MNIDQKPEFETERLCLKILDPSHVKLIHEYYSRNKSFFSEFIPLYKDSFASVDLLLNQLWKEYDLIIEKRALRFYLFEKDDFSNSNILGDISVSNILLGGLRNCQLGYKLDLSVTGLGYMFEALQRIINFLFIDLRLHRLEAYIMPSNEKSIRLIERLEFKPEGIAEKYMLIKDIWEDHLRYVSINPDVNN